MARYLLFLSFNLLTLGSFAQSYCFLNEGLKIQTKISFTLHNNRITQGRWESWDYSADSSEVFPFEGVKVGLKLKVVFPEKDFQRGQIYGGLLFGLGWAITGACPGPLFAQIGAGFPAILITLLSAIAGTWVYGYVRAKLPH